MTLRHFKAYLDDLQSLTICLPKRFPHQQIAFVLEEKDRHDQKIHTWIEQEYTDDDAIYYRLSLQSPLDLEKRYLVYDSDRNVQALTYRHIVRTPIFDQTFDARNFRLGASYQQTATIFRLWAPISDEVWLQIEKDGHKESLALNYREKGVWELRLTGDWEGASYRYLHLVNGQWQEVHDPYAISSTSNSGASYVINPSRLHPVSPLKKELPKAQAIVYEMSVRDFSAQDSAGFSHKRQFKGLTESPKTGQASQGFDYLKELGISHIQLMPLYDFGSVDEEHPRLCYNWGYDPVQYNVPDGSFVSDPDHPYNRLTDLQDAISLYHQAGIGVIMDVVYNHVYDIDQYAFEKIVPGYCYRVDLAGKKSNGSWCGNDMATERLMMRDYIVKSVCYWAQTFDMDGFRFDLMGLIDRQTISDIATQLKAIKPNAYLYGEGWEMGTGLDTQLLAHQNNAKYLPEIGFFNDSYRDTFKKVLTQPQRLLDEHLHQKIENLLSGSIGLSQQTPAYLTADQSINYLECHDNATFFDYIRLKLPTIHRGWQEHIASFGLQLQLLSQGVCFIHSGQEFFRTKNHLENSYNSPDSINRLDWKRRQTYAENAQFISELIAFRKSEPLLALNQTEAIQKASHFYWLNPYVLRYNLYKDQRDLEIVINFSTEHYVYPNDDKRHLILQYPDLNDQGVKENIPLSPQSLIVLQKPTHPHEN
ncbi:type I pullulanase [Streptococcus sp. DD12]|uniref:type I pullulanase n=1 Tax=Streptococcus sp. DD12 TaxID=1777880 RepID=UPI00079A44AB|nr:type I pullulanase [Streptococcus sp. DD12]KXT75845.1 Pullulanase [Streptococcus sp. DD12]